MSKKIALALIGLVVGIVGCSGGSSGLAPSGGPNILRKPSAMTAAGTTGTISVGNMTAYLINSATNAGPSFINFTPDGQLWFTQENNSGIGDLSIAGTSSWSILTGSQTFPQPAMPVVGADGNIWFTEYGANAIARFDPCTHVTTVFHTPTAPSGPWEIVRGPDNALWFNEWSSPDGTYRLGRIDYQGNITEYPLSGPVWKPITPSYLTFGPDGNLWFTEFGNGGVDAFSITSHTVVKQFAASNWNLDGHSPQEPPKPNQIVVGPDNNIWWVDSGTGELAEISPSDPGSTGLAYGAQHGPDKEIYFQSYNPFNANVNWAAHLATGPDGNLWVVDAPADHVMVYSPNQAVAGVATPSPLATYTMSTLGITPGQANCEPGVTPGSCIGVSGLFPFGIAAGPDGRMWVALYNGNAVVAIKP